MRDCPCLTALERLYSRKTARATEGLSLAWRKADPRPLRPVRPGIADRPSSRFDAGDEIADRCVEQGRLLLVHRMAGLGKHREPRCRHPLLEPEARLQTGLILVADNDQAGCRDLADVSLEIVDRRPRRLKAAQGARRTLRIVRGKAFIERSEAARVLDQKRD